MITENLSTLNIHRLTNEQYKREFEAGRLDDNALYLTPDEEIDVDLSNYATLDQLNGRAEKVHFHAVSEVNELTDILNNVDISIANIIDGTTTVKRADSANTASEATHAVSADSASTATTAQSATEADSAKTAESATKATQDASGNIITSTYETKENATAKLDEAKDYTDKKVEGLASTTVVENEIGEHNVSTSAHNDLRILMEQLSTKVNNFLDVDEETTDQLSEVLELIEKNKETLDELLDDVLKKSDIINNLTTNLSDQVLSAAQGVELKRLIDELKSILESFNYAGSAEKGGPANSAVKLTKPITISLTGGIIGSVDSFDGSANTSINTIVQDDSHCHVIKNVDNLEDELAGKQSKITGGATTITDSNLTASRALVSDANGKVAVSDITSTELGYLEYLDGVKENVQTQLNTKANKTEIATTAMQGTATGSTTYWKISDFGNWGTGNWTQKGFSMLISSRAGELVWVSLAANDSNTSAEAIRLINRYSKINALHYSVSENAIYVTAVAWANNICAHILSNVNGDYVPTISSVSSLPAEAVKINITEFGVNSDGVMIGDAARKLRFAGSDQRPSYGNETLALYKDVTAVDEKINNHASAVNPHGITPELIGALSLDGGTLKGSLDFSNKSSWITPYLLSFKNAAPDTSPTYPYTGFYQWNDEWQVNARDANNNFAHNILSINLKTKVANFDATPTVAGKNLALYEDISTAINNSCVQYRKNENVSIGGATKSVYRLLPPETDGNTGVSSGSAYFPEGIVMGGSAASAGLMARGICGITTPDASTGTCNKDNLYLNYDGTNDYSSGRQVVIQAGSVGTHYGNNLYQYAAARGDAVKGYCDATYVNAAGDVMTGRLQMNMSNPHVHFKDTGYSTDWYIQAYQDQFGFGTTWTTAFKSDKSGNVSASGSVTVNNKVKMQYDSTNECMSFVFI